MLIDGHLIRELGKTRDISKGILKNFGKNKFNIYQVSH